MIWFTLAFGVVFFYTSEQILVVLYYETLHFVSLLLPSYIYAFVFDPSRLPSHIDLSVPQIIGHIPD